MTSFESKNDNDFVVVGDELATLSIFASGSSPAILSSAKAWNAWETGFSDEKHPEVAIYGGVPVVLMTEMTPAMTAAIASTIPVSQGLGAGNNDNMACTACRNRLPKLLRMRDADGEPYFMPGPKASYPANFWPLWSAARSGTVESVQVVTADQFGFFQSGGFRHFSVDTGTDIPDVKDVDAHQRLLDKYIPFMTRVFTENGVEGIKASLETLIKVLPTVTYGGKLLESAIWFAKHIREDFGRLNKLRQFAVLSAAIFDLKYCREIGSNDVSLPLYHQLSKNTLDALAVCDSVGQLGALLKDRLSPLNYQVKSGAVSDGQVEMALKHIGEFGTKLMTVKSALEHKAVEVKHRSMSSSSSAFGAMKSKRASRRGAAGFAGRSKADVKTIRSMKDLMANMPENLEVSVSGQTPVYAVDFTGQDLCEAGVYQTPFTWGFKNGYQPSVFKLYGWAKVLAILPMKTNFLFICEGAQVAESGMGPCCHVSLLTAGYNKSCGKAFGTLKDHMKLEIEGDGPYAMGVGVSLDAKRLDDDNPPIVGTVTLRSNGTSFVIS